MSSSTATNPIIDSEKWTEGDFTIVSADGVRFKAPSKVLLYHSDVLANAAELSGNSDKVLQFSDQDLEQAEIIDWFLDLAVNLKLSVSTATGIESEANLTKDLLTLVRFLQKYECTSLWRQLHLACLEQLFQGNMSPQIAFVVGSASGNFDMCATALDKMCENNKLPYKGADADQRHRCAADPGNFSPKLWDLLNHEHAWAYCAAFSQAAPSADHCNEYMHRHHLGSYFKDVIRGMPSF